MKANIIFDKQSAIRLRNLAASLEMFIQRGAGTGTVGNIRELMQEIADAYAVDPSTTTACIKKIIQVNHNKDEREIDQMIKETGAIIL
jgi:hypothetical protein